MNLKYLVDRGLEELDGFDRLHVLLIILYRIARRRLTARTVGIVVRSIGYCLALLALMPPKYPLAIIAAIGAGVAFEINISTIVDIYSRG